MTAQEEAWLRAEAAARRLPVADLTALQQALTHKSLVPDAPLRSNERLEFLGDAVLGLVVAEYLCTTFPRRSEGELAKAKSLIVCKNALAAAAWRLDLTPLLQIGRAEEAMGGRSRASIAADAFEALIAMVYNERGYQAARAFILDRLAPEIAEVEAAREWRDPKSILQELRQGARRPAPAYDVVSEEGRPHDRTYTIQVRLDGAVAGEGRGKSKKEAEQAAAEAALQAMR